MEESGGGEGSFSPSWRRDALRRLRWLRISSDPLLSRLSSGDGSPTSRRSVVVVRGTVPKGKPARDRRDMFSHFSFWKRIVGIVVAVAVILPLTWITLNPPKLLQLELCPDDWLYYKKKCYYHSASRSPADWNSSQEACSNYGASLAVIDSHQELIS